jgi:hypothetical protein
MRIAGHYGWDAVADRYEQLLVRITLFMATSTRFGPDVQLSEQSPKMRIAAHYSWDAITDRYEQLLVGITL